MKNLVALLIVVSLTSQVFAQCPGGNCNTRSRVRWVQPTRQVQYVQPQVQTLHPVQQQVVRQVYTPPVQQVVQQTSNPVTEQRIAKLEDSVNKLIHVVLQIADKNEIPAELIAPVNTTPVSTKQSCGCNCDKCNCINAVAAPITPQQPVQTTSYGSTGSQAVSYGSSGSTAAPYMYSAPAYTTASYSSAGSSYNSYGSYGSSGSAYGAARGPVRRLVAAIGQRRASRRVSVNVQASTAVRMVTPQPEMQYQAPVAAPAGYYTSAPIARPMTAKVYNSGSFHSNGSGISLDQHLASTHGINASGMSAYEQELAHRAAHGYR